MKLLIFGAGGYGLTVADLAQQSGDYTAIHFLDDNSTGPDILGRCDEFSKFADGDTQMYPAFGNNEGRLAWLKKLGEAGIPVPTLVHASAYVSPTAVLEDGVMVLPHALIGTGCTVRFGCIVNGGAIIDHGCVLEECVHICLGAIVKAENRIPACCKIEAGQIVQNRSYPV